MSFLEYDSVAYSCFCHYFTPRYNVDCAASEGLYGLAEGAFGSGGDGGGDGGGGAGECPAAAPLSGLATNSIFFCFHFVKTH